MSTEKTIYLSEIQKFGINFRLVFFLHYHGAEEDRDEQRPL